MKLKIANISPVSATRDEFYVFPGLSNLSNARRRATPNALSRDQLNTVHLITLLARATSWLLNPKVRQKLPAETVAQFGRTLGLTPHRTTDHLARLISPQSYAAELVPTQPQRRDSV